MMDEDKVALTRLGAQMENVVEALKELKQEVRAQRVDNVARTEWLQRNAAVDSKFDSQGSEISQIRQDIASRRAPWWIIAGLAITFFFSVATFAWTVLGPIITAAGN